MRFFIELAYKGTAYAGWQRQNNAVSVQSTVEDALSTILNTPTKVTGCGRTDAGVHASQYFLHFDYTKELPNDFLSRLNKFLPKDIALKRVFQVADDAHTRFDATRRSYEYYMNYQKSPFSHQLSWYYHAGGRLSVDRLNACAQLLLEYEAFAPFCKTGSDVKTMNCALSRSEWIADEAKHQLVFHVTSNRFLRGMVRLIVGTCVLVAEEKLSLESVKASLEAQTSLDKSWSAPPDGLYLSEVGYDYVE